MPNHRSLTLKLPYDLKEIQPTGNKVKYKNLIYRAETLASFCTKRRYSCDSKEMFGKEKTTPALKKAPAQIKSRELAPPSKEWFE